MIKKISLLIAIGMVALMLAPGNSAAQHEGHGPGATTPSAGSARPDGRGDEMSCQRMARLAAELDEEMDEMLEVSDLWELQERLTAHKVKLQELRTATGACSQQCEKRSKRKGCGHRMSH